MVMVEIQAVVVVGAVRRLPLLNLGRKFPQVGVLQM